MIDRSLFFLIPRTDIESGGLSAHLGLYEMARNLCQARLVTYQRREAGILFLDDLARAEPDAHAIFIVHWGPHVSWLLESLAPRNCVYFAYSTGWGCRIPPQVPIVAASRHTQAYWGRRMPDSALYYLPPIISEEFRNRHQARDIDVLVQTRKSSVWLLDRLVPELQKHIPVVVVDRWVDDLSVLFNRSKVYLYDSSEHWTRRHLTEGFGLPPLQAMASGCSVFSSLNDALSDYLDPGFNCQKLHMYSTAYDVERILRSVGEWRAGNLSADPAAEYRLDVVERRLDVILRELDSFFTALNRHKPDRDALWPGSKGASWRGSIAGRICRSAKVRRLAERILR